MATLVQKPKRKKPEAKVVVRGNRGVKIVKSCLIHRSASELYEFWRRLENLPRFMPHLVSVKEISTKDSHWVAKGPAGKRIEWDAVIINDHENSLIAWRTREGASVPHAGSVRFEPAKNGLATEVTVALEYNPPAGKLGKLVAKLFGAEPGQQIEDDLDRFKRLVEAGEVPLLAATPVSAAKRRITTVEAPIEKKVRGRRY